METTLLHLIAICWINFVIAPIPKRAVSTYVELLIGTVLSGTGHVTDAMLEVGHQKHFTTYYKMLGQGQWSWIAVAKQLVLLIVKYFPRKEWNLVVDDFIIPRVSEKAPGVKYHHEHSQKPNRAKYIWGQQWISLGLALPWGKICACIPILLRLHRKVGNTSKIKRAIMLIKLVLPWFKQQKDEIVMRVLVDCWYMKRTFILPMIELGLNVIGQVRKDTALFFKPDPKSGSKRGRPRKYGNKINKAEFEKFPIITKIIKLYGKRQVVKYKSTKCLARFLKGAPVIAVWCQLKDQKGWTLILSTDLTLTPERIIKLYGRRWKTEPMFNEIKNLFGITRAWEQTSRALHRWVSMICLSYAINRLLSLLSQSKNFDKISPFIQWRQNSVMTAGLIRMGLKILFRHFSFFELWNPKSKKLILPIQSKNPKKLSKL
jgi:hypothetical protein